MTWGYFGKIVPSQMYVLMLIGWKVGFCSESFLDIPKEEKIEIMRSGRKNLVKMTGKDFGFDLKMWHEYLLKNPEKFGYTHSYGFARVKKEVLETIKDKKRNEIRNKILKEYGEI